MKKLLMNHDKSGIKEYIFQNFYKPNLKSSQLKSSEALETQARDQIDEAYDHYVDLLVDGLQLFQKLAKDAEKEQLQTVLNKATEENSDHPLDFKDGAFLCSIAARELAENHNENAAQMFSWIILCLPLYSPAWVGSAIAEQQMAHFQEAVAILELGMEFLPKDYFLRRYAAEFYMTQKKLDRALEILESSLAQLKADGQENSHDFKLIYALLPYGPKIS